MTFYRRQNKGVTLWQLSLLILGVFVTYVGHTCPCFFSSDHILSNYLQWQQLILKWPVQCSHVAFVAQTLLICIWNHYIFLLLFGWQSSEVWLPELGVFFHPNSINMGSNCATYTSWIQYIFLNMHIALSGCNVWLEKLYKKIINCHSNHYDWGMINGWLDSAYK